MNINILSYLKRHPFSITECLKNRQAGDISGENFKKKGVIVFGCGFASGLDLEKNQKFEAKLSALTKRPVYNYGIAGGYIQHAILTAKSGIIDKYIKDSDYAIYIISGTGDGPRLKVFPGKFFDCLLIDPEIYPVLKEKNNDLVISTPKFPLFSDTPVIRIIRKYYIENKEKEYLNDTYLHLIKLQKELKKRNPNIKLIVFLYFSPKELFSEYEEKFKENDIYLFSLPKETIEEIKEVPKYIYSQAHFHPTEQAWDRITPLLKEEFKGL